MSTSRTVLQCKDTSSPGALYMSFDLGDKKWQISLSDGRSGVSRHTVAAGSPVAVADCITKAAKRFKVADRALVHSVYEAGRDGWWFHRWLCELGVDNIVVDPSSIEVNRRARQAKTDRLDAESYWPCSSGTTAVSACGRYCESPAAKTKMRGASCVCVQQSHLEVR